MVDSPGGKLKGEVNDNIVQRLGICGGDPGIKENDWWQDQGYGRHVPDKFHGPLGGWIKGGIKHRQEKLSTSDGAVADQHKNRVDFVLAHLAVVVKNVVSRNLTRQDFVCVTRTGHP